MATVRVVRDTAGISELMSSAWAAGIVTAAAIGVSQRAQAISGAPYEISPASQVGDRVAVFVRPDGPEAWAKDRATKALKRATFGG